MLLNIILFIILILFAIMVGVTVFDSNRFVMREYTYVSDKVSKDYDFLFVSDLHCKEYGPGNKRLKKAIEGINADGCFMAGDIVNALPNADISKAVDFIDFVNKRMPVFYSFGNHEFRLKNYVDMYPDMYEEYTKKLTDIGVKLYDDEKISFDELDIYSLNLDGNFYHRFMDVYMPKEYLHEKLGVPCKERFSFLLAHNPEYFDRYSEFGVDCVLSGHVHGGIARIPGGKGVISPRLKFFPEYDGGEFEKNGTKMLLSRGIGAHSIPFRLFNPGELIVIHIKKH